MSIDTPAKADTMNDHDDDSWPAPRAPRSTLASIGLAWLMAGAAIAVTIGFVAGRLTAPSADKVTAGATVTTVASSSTKSLPAGTPTLEQALALHTAGKLDEAVVAYRAIASADPSNKFARYNLGQIAQQRGDAAQASADYAAALKIDGNYVPALYNLSLIKAAAGDSAGAIALLRAAVAADPTNANAVFNLGKLLVAGGDAQEGADMIAKAVAIDPSLKP